MYMHNKKNWKSSKFVCINPIYIKTWPSTITKLVVTPILSTFTKKILSWPHLPWLHSTKLNNKTQKIKTTSNKLIHDLIIIAILNLQKTSNPQLCKVYCVPATSKNTFSSHHSRKNYLVRNSFESRTSKKHSIVFHVHKYDRVSLDQQRSHEINLTLLSKCKGLTTNKNKNNWKRYFNWQTSSSL